MSNKIQNSNSQKNNLHNLKGEQKDQLLIVTDKKGNRLGTATRVECHKGFGKPHLAFAAFLINEKNEIILTKRSRKKSLWANCWDASVVSHVLPGEIVETAVNRRGKEELGIDVKFKDLGAFYYLAKHDKSSENEFCHVLIGKTDQRIVPNPVEIADIKKVTFHKLQKELDNNPEKFTPWFKLSMEKFDLSKYI